MKKSVSERLKFFIAQKGLSIRAFERTCNLSNGYVNGIETTIMPNKLSTIRRQYPELNIDWLLYGEGEMLKAESLPVPKEAQRVMKPQFKDDKYRLVPVLNLDARGGFADNLEDGSEYAVDMIPFRNARVGDICVPITGDSMSPTYRPGSLALIRKIDDWYDFIEYGQVYVIELNDGRRIIKEIRACREDSDNKYLCISHNPTYDPVVLPKRKIRRMFLVLATYSVATM